MIKFIMFFLFSTMLWANTYLSKEEKNWINNNSNVSIAMINNFSPFSFEQNSIHQGFTLDLLKLIEEKSGLHFNIQTSKWSTALEKFREEKVDMISDISFTNERKAFTLFTDSYYDIPTFIFGLEPIEKYVDNSSLIGKKVGVSKNIFYINELKTNNITPIEFDSSANKVIALATGKIDYFLASYTSGINAIAQQSIITIKPIDELKSIKKEDLRFGITPSKPILHSIIQKSLQQISTKEINQLAIKWVLVNNSVKSDETISFTNEEKQYIKNAQKIKIGSIDTYTPFSFMQNDSKIGFTQDLISIISQKSGLEFEKIGGTWPEVFGSFENGSIDIISEFSLRPERLEYTIYTQPYYEIPIGVFTRKDFGVYKDIQSLKGKKVGIVKGSYLSTILDKIPDIQVVEISSSDNRFYALNNNEVDVVLSNAMSLYRITESLLLKNIMLAGYFTHDEAKTEDLRFGIRKEHPILASIMKKTLDAIDYAQLTKLKNKWIYQSTQIAPENIPQSINQQITLLEKKFIDKNPIIRFKVNPNNPPFEFEQNGKAVGIAVDYVKLSANNVGLNVEFVLNNSNDESAYDTKLFDIKSESLNNQFSFGIPYLSYPIMIITNKQSQYINSLENLANRTIALEENSTIKERLKKDYPKINIINTKTSQEALQLVNDEKVDAYIGNLGIANYMNNFQSMSNLKVASSTEYGNIQYNFVAPKDWSELASLLSKGFEKIPQVEHNAIAQKWFVFPTIEKIDYDLVWKILVFVVIILLFFVWWNRTLAIEKNKTKKALQSLQKSQKKLKDKNDELAQSKLLLESVINENPNPIMIKNSKDMFVLVNKAFANLYSKSTVLMIDKTDKDFTKIDPLAIIMNQDSMQILNSNNSKIRNIFDDVQVETNEGNKHYMIIKKPFKNHKNEKHILVIANDITMIKALEDEKLQQQKFIFNQSKIAAMGDMVANIAHQWRQPLSVISTVSTGSKLKKEMNMLKDEEFIENMEIINTNVQYLSSTIDTFRNFLKEEKVYKEVILQERINLTLDIYGTAIKNHQINLINNIDYNHPIKIHLVVGELSQVLGNILSNAKDVLLERKIQDAWIKLEMEKNDEFITITIEDNAGGINPEYMSRIFEPYFTTKHSSQGTGLGLHMSYKIITESLKGKLYAKNTQNGAKFFIELPLHK